MGEAVDGSSILDRPELARECFGRSALGRWQILLLPRHGVIRWRQVTSMEKSIVKCHYCGMLQPVEKGAASVCPSCLLFSDRWNHPKTKT